MLSSSACIRIAERANDSFSSLVAFGLLASWFTHVLENVGMTLNLMPITGIPLPFFSYGGSFMLACWLRRRLARFRRGARIVEASRPSLRSDSDLAIAGLASGRRTADIARWLRLTPLA